MKTNKSTVVGILLEACLHDGAVAESVMYKSIPAVPPSSSLSVNTCEGAPLFTNELVSY